MRRLVLRKILVLLQISFLAFSSSLLAQITPEEQQEINDYIRSMSLQGTWQERAIRAYVRMENTGNRSLLIEEIRPELDWMANTLEVMRPATPSMAETYRRIAIGIRQLAQTQQIPQVDLECVLRTFARAISFQTSELSRPGAEDLVEWWRGDVDLMLKFKRVGWGWDSQRRTELAMLWPVVPSRGGEHGLMLSQRDFVSLVPFLIIPLELVAQASVDFDRITASAETSLDHDSSHGWAMLVSWLRDAEFLGLVPVSTGSVVSRLTPEIRPILRGLRRSLVLGVNALPSHQQTRFVETIFEFSHENTSISLFSSAAGSLSNSSINPLVLWNRFRYSRIVRPLQSHCAELMEALSRQPKRAASQESGQA